MSLRKYEAVFILDERKFDDGGDAFITRKVAERIKTLGGEPLEHDNMGKRQLVYPINRKNTGHYWAIIFNLAADKAKEFKDTYKLDAAVLKLEVFLHERPAVTRLERPEMAIE